MVSEKLKEWIKQKRQEGISDERIKKSLDKTGYDPSIVDELDDPFDGENSNTEPSEDLFNTSNQGDDESERGFSDDSREERVQGIADNLSDKNSKEDSKEDSVNKEITSPKTKPKASDNSFLDGLEFDLPSFNLPSIQKPSFDRVSKPDFSSPSINLPSAPDISRKQLTLVFALLLVLGGGFGAYSFLPDDFNPRLLLGPELNSATHLQTLEQLDQRFAGCPDVGVSIQNVSTSGGSTTADVLVTGEAWVVLEVLDNNGKVIGFSTRQVNSETQIKVNKLGNKAELRPLGCEEHYSRTDIN